MNRGNNYIYILESSELTDLIKIEYTEGDDKEISSKILGPTGTPVLFEVVYKKSVENPREEASRLRKSLLKAGVRKGRDFFKISKIEAVEIAEIIFESRTKKEKTSKKEDRKNPKKDKRSISEKESKKRGYVYVISNPEMPEVVKIGSTERSPKVRAEEISSSTGVPTEFEVKYKRAVKNPKKEELKVHRYLSKERISTKREFFRVSEEEAIEAIDNLIGE